uniref:Uncharacterized protein n=1 Tax=Steinernema glaseri TaxID=37863 RepID=A0A1I7Z3D3_9BILA
MHLARKSQEKVTSRFIWTVDNRAILEFRVFQCRAAFVAPPNRHLFSRSFYIIIAALATVLKNADYFKWLEPSECY